MNKLEQIEKLKEHYKDLASYWNGEDSTFNYKGLFYSEDDASCALEIVKVCETLCLLISDIENL